MTRRTVSGSALAAALAACIAARAAPLPGGQGSLVVIDSAGHEQKLRTFKFTAGLRNLSWLAPAPSGAGDTGGPRRPRARPAQTGPEALEFREEDSTSFVEGVLTLVPIDRLRAVEYDNEQKTVTARVAGPKAGEEIALTGTTRFERVNKLALEADVDRGDLGIAEVRYLGGTQNGIRGLRFPEAKPAAAPAGRVAVVTTTGKDPSTHKVFDLKALYLLPSGHERLIPLLMFKKTLKLDIAKIKAIKATGADDDEGGWQVLLKNGGDETLSLLRVIQLDGTEAQLEGMLGSVPAGYKLFPVATIAEVQFDAEEAKPDSKPEK